MGDRERGGLERSAAQGSRDPSLGRALQTVAFHNLRRILITLNVVSLDALCSTSDSSHSPQHWMDYDRECDKNTTFSVINDSYILRLVGCVGTVLILNASEGL
jgi:hypothetical protein